MELVTHTAKITKIDAPAMHVFTKFSVYDMESPFFLFSLQENLERKTKI